MHAHATLQEAFWKHKNMTETRWGNFDVSDSFKSLPTPPSRIKIMRVVLCRGIRTLKNWRMKFKRRIPKREYRNRSTAGQARNSMASVSRWWSETRTRNKSFVDSRKSNWCSAAGLFIFTVVCPRYLSWQTLSVAVGSSLPYLSKSFRSLTLRTGQSNRL